MLKEECYIGREVWYWREPSPFFGLSEPKKVKISSEVRLDFSMQNEIVEVKSPRFGSETIFIVENDLLCHLYKTELEAWDKYMVFMYDEVERLDNAKDQMKERLEIAFKHYKEIVKEIT
jgi:hypothetical protein